MSRRLGEYVPLSVDYPDDDAIMACTPLAELLFIRCIALSRRLKSDGYLTESQLIHRAGARIASPQRLRAYTHQLVSVGLLVKADGGYVIRAYLKWNKSAEELGRELARDRQRKRADRENPAGFQPETERNPGGVQADSERIPDLSNRIPASRAPARTPAYAGDRTVPDRTEPQTPVAEVINSNVEGVIHRPPAADPDIGVAEVGVPHGLPPGGIRLPTGRWSAEPPPPPPDVREAEEAHRARLLADLEAYARDHPEAAAP